MSCTLMGKLACINPKAPYDVRETDRTVQFKKYLLLTKHHYFWTKYAQCVVKAVIKV